VPSPARTNPRNPKFEVKMPAVSPLSLMVVTLTILPPLGASKVIRVPVDERVKATISEPGEVQTVVPEELIPKH